jgi:hypothetical protein
VPIAIFPDFTASNHPGSYRFLSLPLQVNDGIKKPLRQSGQPAQLGLKEVQAMMEMGERLSDISNTLSKFKLQGGLLWQLQSISPIK